jgi:hypothetical protein
MMDDAPRFLHLGLHWDIEWRQTRLASARRYCAILGYVVDRLLDDASPITRFSVDSNGHLLEQVAEFDPPLFARVRECIAKGLITPGPWYVHTEPLQVSGESLIRNLQAGQALADGLGRSSTVAYSPDAGGFPAQLPQILSKCGIKSFVGWRGVTGSEHDPIFWWRGPDGSQILAWEMTDGIGDYTGTDLFDDEGRPAASLRDRWSAASGRWRHIAPFWICAVSGKLERFERFLNANPQITQVSSDEYGAAVSPAVTSHYSGELRDSHTAVLMAGAPSARVRYKRATRSLERMLVRSAEPMAAIALLAAGVNYANPLRAAWHALLNNLAEDIVRGCAKDEVYYGAWYRDSQARDLLDETTNEMMLKLARTVDFGFLHEGETGFILINTSADAADGIIEVALDIPMDHSADLEIFDHQRNLIPASYLDSSPTSTIRYLDDMAAAPSRVLNRLRFALDMRQGHIPSFGYRCFGARYRGLGRPTDERGYGRWLLPPVQAPVPSLVMTNDIFRVEIRSDGSLDILELSSGEWIRGSHVLADAGDRGDLYNFDPVPGSATVTTAGTPCSMAMIASTSLTQTVRCEWRLLVPAGINESRTARSAEQRPLLVRTDMTLTAGSKIIDFRTRIENSSHDHKLTAWFFLNSITDAVDVHQQFAVVRRDIRRHSSRGHFEDSQGMGPQLDFVALRTAQRTLLLANEGIPGYEVKDVGTDTAIGITLLRAVGTSSRPYLSTRPAKCGPSLPTPDAQLEGSTDVRYGLAFGAGYWADDTILAVARRWLSRVLCYQLAYSELTVGWRYPALGSMVRVTPACVEVTALKPALDGAGVIVRFWNPCHEPSNVRVGFASEILEAYMCDLRELYSQSLELSRGEVSCRVMPGEIVTIYVRTKEPDR